MVVAKKHHHFLLSLAHNDVGHHGFYAKNALLSEQYWWPHITQDIAWFVLTCHICQVWKTQKILILQIVAMPAPLFSKVYIDTNYAYANILWLQIHSSRPLFFGLLAGVDSITEGIR
jgi:Integrase zinc binding domain